MNTNRCNQTMIERGMAEGWSADAIISVPGSSADRSNRAEGTCARGLLILRESECARVAASAAARHRQRRPPAQEGPGGLAISAKPLARGGGKTERSPAPLDLLIHARH
jgi:hypothetical protein